MKSAAYASLAAFPGKTVAEAMALAGTAFAVGDMRLDQVQIGPQNAGALDWLSAQALQEAYPDTCFRLHANARVDGWSSLADLASLQHHAGYFIELAKISLVLEAPAYTLHAGLRRNAGMATLQSNLLICEELFECPVGVEGMYPTDNDRYNVSTWQEYRAMFDRGMRYALDLSHLNILACKTGVRDDGLVREMLASEQCLEIHVSGNDGETDQHTPIVGETWWMRLLEYAHPAAVMFTEENRLRR